MFSVDTTKTRHLSNKHRTKFLQRKINEFKNSPTKTNFVIRFLLFSIFMFRISIKLNKKYDFQRKVKMYKCILKSIDNGTFKREVSEKHAKLFEDSKTWRQPSKPTRLKIHESDNDMTTMYKTLEFFNQQRTTAPKFNYKEPK